MPVRMSVLHCIVSVLLLLLLLGANSNGGILTHKDEPPIWGTPSQLLASMDEGPNNHFPHPSRFIRKLELAPSPESGIPSSPNCSRSGVFAMQGTCRGFYMCHPLSPDSGVYSMSLRSCSPDSIFDDVSAACLPSSQAITRPECKAQASKRNDSFESEGDEGVKVVMSLVDTSFDRSTSLRRQKRDLLFSSGSSARDFIFKAENVVNGASIFMGGETNLNRIENKLIGCQGKLNNLGLPVLESQAATKLFGEITQLIADTRLSNIQRNFDKIQTLLRGGILEDHAITAVLQGMINNGNKMNEFNLAEVKVTLKEVDNFINREINKSKLDLRQGFELLSDSINVSVIKPFVSKLLNLITEFKQKLNQLQSLPEGNQESEIERSGGYGEYLLPPTLQDTLYGNIDRAIPSGASDKTSLVMLDLLVEGLKIHANLLSFAVSANVFSAEKALRNRDIEEFNTRMIRVESAIRSMKTSMGTSSTSGGLLSKINLVLDKVEQLPYASTIDGLTKSLSGKRAEVAQVKSDINRLFQENTVVIKPDTITRALDFSVSSIPLPVGQWETGKQVSYAMQFVSRNGLSKVSDWSSPYNIQDKAHPIVHIPTAKKAMTRLVYRRFNQDKPELVAILTDNKLNSFRDIDRDLITVVSSTNLDDAVGEVRALLNDGANVNVRVENKLTPLHYAAKYDNVEVMDILISEAADVSAKSLNNEEPLHLAALSDATDAIQILVSKGANVNAKTNVLGLSPLHIAVANNHELAAEALIYSEASVNINIRDNNGLSPLHYAVAGNDKALDLLLESDALDINAVTKSGLTPLHLAAAVSNGLLVEKILRRNNIDVGPLINSQLHSVHLASIYDNAGAIGSMIQQGLVSSMTDKDGSTTLHYAVFFGNMKSFLALMQVDQSLKSVLNNDGKTVLDVARENKRESIRTVLSANKSQLNTIIKKELEKISNEIGEDESQYLKGTSSCITEISQEIIKSSEAICGHVSSVDSYVNLVKRMIPLKDYHKGEYDYTIFLNNYDSNLANAKNHAKLWRDGDSIVSGIRQTFKLAKEFEPEFSRKYVITQRRIKSNINKELKRDTIKKTGQEILKVEEDIRDATEMLKTTKPKWKKFMNEMLTSYKEKLIELQKKLKKDHLLKVEVDQIALFLEYVKIDAGEIRAKASATKEKIETFLNNLKHDKSAFARDSKASKTNLKQFHDDVVKKDATLTGLQTESDQLSREVEAQKVKVSCLESEKEDTGSRLSDMKGELRRRVASVIISNIWVAILCGFTIFTLNIPIIIACFVGLGVSIGVQTHQVNTLKNSIRMTEEEITTLHKQINTNTIKRDEINQIFIDKSTETEEERKERYRLVSVTYDLESVSSNSDALVKALKKALVGVTVLKDVFDGVEGKLDSMINAAKTAGDKVAGRKITAYILGDIKDMKCEWKDVYISVRDLDQCTRNIEILNLTEKR